jgi:hypothetical protein
MKPSLLLCAIALSGALHAQTAPYGLSVDRNPAQADQPVQVVVNFGAASRWCGLRVELGDGEVRDFVVENFPLTLTKHYAAEGRYVLRAQGRFVARGLSTGLACDGAPRTLTLVVEARGSAPTGRVDERAREQRKRDDERAREQQKRDAEQARERAKRERERERDRQQGDDQDDDRNDNRDVRRDRDARDARGDRGDRGDRDAGRDRDDRDGRRDTTQRDRGVAGVPPPAATPPRSPSTTPASAPVPAPAASRPRDGTLKVF